MGDKTTDVLSLLEELRAKNYLVQHIKVGDIEVVLTDHEMTQGSYKGTSGGEQHAPKSALEELAQKSGFGRRITNDD